MHPIYPGIFQDLPHRYFQWWLFIHFITCHGFKVLNRHLSSCIHRRTSEGHGEHDVCLSNRANFSIKNKTLFILIFPLRLMCPLSTRSSTLLSRRQNTLLECDLCYCVPRVWTCIKKSAKRILIFRETIYELFSLILCIWKFYTEKKSSRKENPLLCRVCLSAFHAYTWNNSASPAFLLEIYIYLLFEEILDLNFKAMVPDYPHLSLV